MVGIALTVAGVVHGVRNYVGALVCDVLHGREAQLPRRSERVGEWREWVTWVGWVAWVGEGECLRLKRAATTLGSQGWACRPTWNRRRWARDQLACLTGDGGNVDRTNNLPRRTPRRVAPAGPHA